MSAIDRPKHVTVQHILLVVCGHFDVDPDHLMSQRRTGHLLWPRHIVLALSARLTPHSLPRIGKLIGGRDHTTVCHAIRVFERRTASDAAAAADVAAILAKIERRQYGLHDGLQRELAQLQAEIDDRSAELTRIHAAIEVAQRRLGSIRNGLLLIEAARLMARTARRASEAGPNQQAARIERDAQLQRLVAITGAKHD